MSAGVGPAFLVQGGHGSSLLARHTDLGAVLTAAGSLAIAGPLELRFDLQQYLFSSDFSAARRPPSLGLPDRPAGARLRHELVVLAGLSWRGD